MFIINPLSGGNLANLFSTHPPLEERIARLRGQEQNGMKGSGHRPSDPEGGRETAERAWRHLSG
jgi:heat shock protein HtpX